MGLFGFGNKKEERHITSVLKNSSINGEMVWRHHSEDFNNKSTLIVQPGEEAIFVKNGVIEGVFTSGTYELTTENYPFLQKLLNKLTGNKNVFTCSVFFVRTASSAEVLWGTDTPIQVRDKLTDLAVDITARGSYKVTIGDASTFLVKLLGNGYTTFTTKDVKSYFGNEMLEHIRVAITRNLQESDDVLGISARQSRIADEIRPFIQEALDEYGIKLLKFSINAIELKKDAKYEEFEQKNLDITTQKRAFDKLGENWDKQQQRDILMKMAEKEGGSSPAMDLGMNMATGMAFMNMTQQMLNPMQQQMQQGMQTPPPPPTSQWYVYLNGQQCGPLSIQQVQQYVMQRQMTINDLVWKAGMPAWLAASNVPEIAALFAQVSPAPPVPPVPPTMG